MFGIHNFTLFLVAGIVLNLTPGPDTAYILGRSIAQGLDAGVALALGIGVATILHTSAAAFGLSAIVATSSFASLPSTCLVAYHFPGNQNAARSRETFEFAVQFSPGA